MENPRADTPAAFGVTPAQVAMWIALLLEQAHTAQRRNDESSLSVCLIMAATLQWTLTGSESPYTEWQTMLNPLAQERKPS